MRLLAFIKVSVILLIVSALLIALFLLFCLLHSVGLFGEALSLSPPSYESFSYLLDRMDVFANSILIIFQRSLLVSIVSVFGAVILLITLTRSLKPSNYYAITLFLLIPFIVGEYIRAFSWLQLANQSNFWSPLRAFVNILSISPLAPVVISQVSAFLPLTLVALLLALPAPSSRVWMVLNEMSPFFFSRLYYLLTQAKTAIFTSFFLVFTLSFFSTVEPEYLGALSLPVSNISFSQIVSTLLNIDPTAKYASAFSLILMIYVFLSASVLARLFLVARCPKTPRVSTRALFPLSTAKTFLYKLSRSDFILRLIRLSAVRSLRSWILSYSESFCNLVSILFACIFILLSVLPSISLLASVLYGIPSFFLSTAPSDYLDPILASLSLAFISSILAIIVGSLLSPVFLVSSVLRLIAFSIILSGAILPGFLFAIILSILNNSLGLILDEYSITVLANLSYLVPFTTISIALAIVSTNQNLLLSSLELLESPLSSFFRLVLPMHRNTFLFTFLLSVVVAFAEGTRASILSGKIVTVSNKIAAGLRSGMTDQSICLAIAAIFVMVGIAFTLILLPGGPVASVKGKGYY